jgi:hypothetical protein
MKNPTLRLVLIGLPAVACLLLGSGCTSANLARVKPWERTLLADYTMNPSRDPLGAASADHVYFSREASTGGKAVGGSGCGCN